MNKRWLLGALAAGLLALSSCYAGRLLAKAASVSDLQQQEEEAKQEEKELQEAKQDLEASLGDLNSELYTVSNSVQELQQQIDHTRTEIARLEEELSEAEEKAERQYEAAKLRIQFLYENDTDFSWVALLEAESFTDFLNRLQYITEITEYDSRLLEDYRQNLETIAGYKTQMEQENQTLSASKEDLQQKEDELRSSIADAQTSLDKKSEELADSQKKSAELAEQIAAMEEYERKLEEQRAREDAKRLEEIKKQEEESQGTAQTPVTPQVGEEELLAALIYCEAGGESYEAQLAVGSVVLNRVNSPYFADTITGVIYEPRQFSPAGSGKLALVLENGLTTESCRRAAHEVLGGRRTGNWLYFRVNNGMIDGTVIGKQVFY